jgi:hypothetical protein
MNFKVSSSSTANQGDGGEDPVTSWTQPRRVLLKSSVSQDDTTASVPDIRVGNSSWSQTLFMLEGTPESQLPLIYV